MSSPSQNGEVSAGDYGSGENSSLRRVYSCSLLGRREANQPEWPIAGESIKSAPTPTGSFPSQIRAQKVSFMAVATTEPVSSSIDLRCFNPLANLCSQGCASFIRVEAHLAVVARIT